MVNDAPPSNGTPPADCVVVHRDAVFDDRERLVAYELELGPGTPVPGATSSAELLTAAFGDLGLRRVVGDHRAYITAAPEVLSAVPALALPVGQLVWQVPEQPVDAEALSHVDGLVKQGFAVSVGGWALEPAAESLLGLATTVKIDFDYGTRELTRLVARGDELHRRGVTLLATNVQTRGEYEEARRLGFDAFQGAYLARPAQLSARRTPTCRMTALTAVLTATGPGAFEDLERLICQDAGLAHRFLRLAGSALYARRTRVRSVHDALTRLGAEAVRRWAVMLALAGLTDTSSERARHLLGIGLHRARICQLLARQTPPACPDRAFTAGLLSILPALVDRPLDELVSELPLEPQLAHALCDHAEPEGRMLAAAIAYENGQRENPDGEPPLLAAITRIYAEALLWADDAARELG